MRYLIITLLLLVSLASCTTPNLFHQSKKDGPNTVEALDSVFHYNPEYQYQVRKGDKISISVWGQDELSVGSLYGIYNSNEVYGKWIMVDAEGNIEAPRLGTLPVEGKTVIELKVMLRTKLAKWIVKPVVDVKVLNKEITILGEVRDPKVITVDRDNSSLMDLVAKCGGFEFYANFKYIKVLRQKGSDVYVANIDLTQSGDYLSRNIQILPGDVVVVPSKGYKEFDKRISNIIPLTTTLTASAIFMGAL